MENEKKSTHEEVPMDIWQGEKKVTQQINMNEIVGTHDILFVCLDTLRYDVAFEAQEAGETPHINQYGKWGKCHASGNFTYPSHHAMFAGFLPLSMECKSMFDQERLFTPKNVGVGTIFKVPKNTYILEEPTIMESLAKVGYHTLCIGGVGFFSKRSEIGKVFPRMFMESHWTPAFGCPVKESMEHQIKMLRERVAKQPKDKRIFAYVNLSAIHYPNAYYLDGAKEDNKETHKAALKYVDSHMPELLEIFKKRGKTFVIFCSDHGSCYGEDGVQFHGLNHEIVNTVPYMHFLL